MKKNDASARGEQVDELLVGHCCLDVADLEAAGPGANAPGDASPDAPPRAEDLKGPPSYMVNMVCRGRVGTRHY